MNLSPEPHPLDPNYLDFSEPQYRMYATEYADVECLVDYEDYLYFTKWLWTLKTNRDGSKPYFRRAVSHYNLTGTRVGSDTIYLHIDILTRAVGPPPTKRRCIADHLNGNSLDNWRCNLEWVTKRQNNQNRFGQRYYQRAMF